MTACKVKVRVILWPTVSRPVCPGVRPPSGTHDQLFITGHLLWWEDGSVIYSCCWDSAVQPFSGPVPQNTWPNCIVWNLRPPPTYLEGHVPVFISPRNNRVAQLYPQALGSLFIALYDSQGYYSGGIRPTSKWDLTACCRGWKCLRLPWQHGLLLVGHKLLYWARTDRGLRYSVSTQICYVKHLKYKYWFMYWQTT
jgi:hypothetical protein